MLRTQKFYSLGLAGMLVAGMALAANADTTAPQTVGIGLSDTDFSTTFAFAQFDPSLGTLTSITINLSGTAVATATVNSITTPTNVTFRSTAEEVLSRPGGGAALITIVPLNPLVQHLGSGGDPSVPYTFPTNTASATSGNQVFNSGADLTLFTGPGPIVLPFDVTGLSGTSGAGTINSTVSTKGSGTATIFYTYTPLSTSTPEPGTWAMMVAGASTGLVALRRRRNKK